VATSSGSRYVFVGGLHRSGTTPIARVLAQHPEISGLSGTGVSEDEGQHLQDVYPRIRVYGGMGRFANAAAAHLTSDSPLVSPGNAERLVAAWSPYWDLRRRLLLEKSPANLIMGDFLQALFPGSALLVVMRHPIAVALAMQKWNPRLIARNGRRRTSMSGLVQHWLRAHEVLREDAPKLARLHVLRYEDLVADPVSCLGAVADFLGLDGSLDPSTLSGNRSDQYKKQWDDMRTGGSVRRRLATMIAQRYGDVVAEYGYDIDRVGEVVAPLDVARVFDTPVGRRE
jgi:hypothetical protein